MSYQKTHRRVLIVSGGDKFFDYFSGILPQSDFDPIVRAHSAGEARRALIQTPADIVIIDTPLPDELGVEFALNIADMSAGILLVVKNELYDKVTYKVEDSGVLTVSKPNSKQAYYGAVKLLAAMSVRLQKMETKNKTLQEKMADIRAVNRAKWLLIEKMNMKESDAHYFIEKRAMDARISRREVAENIIRTYDGYD